eukprot:jgi/Mesen1/7349/ME000377S06561
MISVRSIRASMQTLELQLRCQALPFVTEGLGSSRSSFVKAQNLVTTSCSNLVCNVTGPNLPILRPDDRSLAVRCRGPQRDPFLSPDIGNLRKDLSIGAGAGSIPIRNGLSRSFSQGRVLSGSPRADATPSQGDKPAANYQFFATCLPGLEFLVAAELMSPVIGATLVTPGKAGVAFQGPLVTGYRANLWLRCAVRVLVQLASADLNPRIAAGDSVYAFIRDSVRWDDLVDPREDHSSQSALFLPRVSPLGEATASRGQGRGAGAPGGGGRKAATISVDSRVWDCSNVSNSALVSTRVKDAVCDAVRDAYGGLKPAPPPRREEGGADLPLFVSLYRDRATLYRDMSGGSLHKRGWRDVMHRASLNESVAAGVLSLTGWNSQLAAGLAAAADLANPAELGGQAHAAGSGGRGGDAVPASSSSSSSAWAAGAPRGGSRGSGAGASERLREGRQGGARRERGSHDDDSAWDTPRAHGRQMLAELQVATLGSERARVLLDPMCGSGTLLIEGALMAMNRAPGMFRQAWPFQRWHDYDAAAWESCVQAAQALELSASDVLDQGVTIMGNDIHPGALGLCERDAAAAGVRELLDLSCSHIRGYKPPSKPSLVVVNPPWGTRLGDTSGEEGQWLTDTWQSLGIFLKAECRDAEVYALSGNAEVTKEMRMRASKRWPVSVGGIDCRILRYSVLPAKKIVH